MKPKKKGVYLWKRNRLGEKQMEINYYTKEKKPKKNYKQQWSAYNLAQTQEFTLFQDTLIELIDSLLTIRKPIWKNGRPFMDIGDILFCCVMRVYFGKSTRRNTGYLQLAKGMGYISKIPHFTTL